MSPWESKYESAIIIEKLEFLCKKLYGDYWLWVMYKAGPRPPRDFKLLLNNYEREELELELFPEREGEDGRDESGRLERDGGEDSR